MWRSGLSGGGGGPDLLCGAVVTNAAPHSPFERPELEDKGSNPDHVLPDAGKNTWVETGERRESRELPKHQVGFHVHGGTQVRWTILEISLQRMAARRVIDRDVGSAGSDQNATPG